MNFSSKVITMSNEALPTPSMLQDTEPYSEVRDRAAALAYARRAAEIGIYVGFGSKSWGDENFFAGAISLEEAMPLLALEEFNHRRLSPQPFNRVNALGWDKVRRWEGSYCEGQRSRLAAMKLAVVGYLQTSTAA